MKLTLTDAELRELRLRYNAAYAAYQSCVMAMNEAIISGQKPTPELLENESKALRELTEARAKLLRGLAGRANDDDDLATGQGGPVFDAT